MFTGLVETTGTVVGFTPIDGGARLTLDIPFGSELSLGDSVAVNGCCLTVDALDGNRVSFDLLSQTIRVTSLGNLKPGSLVNLENDMIGKYVKQLLGVFRAVTGGVQGITNETAGKREGLTMELLEEYGI